MSTTLRVPWFAAALPVVLALAAPAAAAPTLEEALVANAPAVVKRLQAMGCRNVGVLKFLATKDGDKLSDNVGTLNMTLANRLEIALLLANDPKTPLGIITNASAVAQRTPGASHLTKDGRLKLFGARYPLAPGRHGTRSAPIPACRERLTRQCCEDRVSKGEGPRIASQGREQAACRADQKISVTSLGHHPVHGHCRTGDRQTRIDDNMQPGGGGVEGPEAPAAGQGTALGPDIDHHADEDRVRR